MDRLQSEEITRGHALTYYDVSERVRSWGRRGILGGGLFGFAFGVVFVAIPQTVNVLAFGVVGTLLVAVLEGAVIAGAFGACAAALCSKDALRRKAVNSDWASGHRVRNVGRQDGDIPLSAWPMNRRAPGLSAITKTASSLRSRTE